MTPTQRLDPDVSQLQQEVAASTSKPVTIATLADYHGSAEDLRGIKALTTKVEETFTPILESIRESEKKTRGIRDSFLTPLKNQRVLIESARDLFERQQELERSRQAARDLEMAEQSRQADIQSMEAMGLSEAADALPPMAPPPPIPELPKSQGVSGRLGWMAELVDLEKLVKAVADGKEPLESLQWSETFWNARARAAKKPLERNGVRFYSKKITSVRN